MMCCIASILLFVGPMASQPTIHLAIVAKMGIENTQVNEPGCVSVKLDKNQAVGQSWPVSYNLPVLMV